MPVECPSEVKPVCDVGYELVQKVGGCCPIYECVCDKSQCDNEVPECPEYHEPVPTSIGSCCPDYECLCRPELCPVTFCGPTERKVRVDDTNKCCPEYR